MVINNIVITSSSVYQVNIQNASEIQEEYTFGSNNTSVITIDSSGRITPVSQGTTTITITGTTSKQVKTVNVKVQYNSHIISFDSRGGTAVDSIPVANNAAIGTLPETHKDHYFFDGWYTSASGGTKITSTYVPTGDMLLYAHYTAAPYYTITFNYNGGSGSESSRSVSADMAIGELPKATRSGFTLIGWKDETTNTMYTSTTKPTKNVTLKAQWG